MEGKKNQLILVEGLTGLGKSTLAHFIASQFQYNGIKAAWIHEGEDPHPVSLDLDGDIETFMDKSIEKWKAFVIQIMKSETTTIIEASFFNNLIETLFSHCLNRTAIIDFGMKLQQVIIPARPALIYLTHPKISVALQENFRNRGTEFQDFVIEYITNTSIAKVKNWDDYAGMVAFWGEFSAITDILFKEYEIDKLAVDVSKGDWEKVHQQVTAFLTLNLVDDPKISFEAAQKYLGCYQFNSGGKCYTIRYEAGYLLTDIFMNVYTKLIPENEGVFLAEKWHFTLHFEFDQFTGDAISFSIGGRDVDYLKAVGLRAEKVMN